LGFSFGGTYGMKLPVSSGLGGNCRTARPLVTVRMKVPQAAAAVALLLPVFQFWS
jgi:hypothetical protein